MKVLGVLHVVPHLDRVGGYERQALALAHCQRRDPTIAPILLTHAAGARPLFESGPAGELHRLPRGLLRHHPGGWWRRQGTSVGLVHAHGMHKLTGQLVALAARGGVPSLVKVATEDDVLMFADPAHWAHLLDGDESAPRGLRWRAMVSTAYRRLRRASLFVALNAAIERQLAEHGLPAVRVPNGVDLERFRPPTKAERDAARAACGAQGNEPVIAYVGRLATRKDVACLASAFARLVAESASGRSPPRLLLAGDGPARAQVERILAAGGCAARATFLGEREDVRPALWAADLFVHPSLREGLPNALLEAWACGLPAVLSDVPGHREAVASSADEAPALPSGDACALFFAPGDAAGLSRALGALLADVALAARLAAAGHERARRVFSLERVAATYARLYAELKFEEAKFTRESDVN